ncbi:hypothetical protein O3M35_012262 [Rhynocoris fuscipes]|uniref:Uncharacterized protein n=1 Tax=Rhynocoris fuscipes TaxID=488301 RepID=A0AAW1CSJ7_9HEMI
MTYFGKKTNVNLLPGVTIFSTEDTKDLMADINSSARNVTEDNVDTFLKESAIKYLGSLNITMQVGRSNILPEIQSFTNEFSGRKRKGLYTTLGTLAAIAFAMLAALTGKALMASLLALLISAISALRGGGIGAGYDYASSAPPAAFGKVTQYDIITRPIVATPYQEHDHHHYNSYIDTYAASGRNIAAIHQDKDTNNEGRKL